MEFRVLGPLEVSDASSPLPLGSGRLLRSLLAVFLARPNQAVSTDLIFESLWPDESPPSADTALRVHLTRLRTRLEPNRPRGVPSTRLVKEPIGYRLCVERDECDALRFNELVALARRTRAAEVAVSAFEQAESLWRGAAFETLDDIDVVRAEAARLHELRATALEERFELQLGLGAHSQLVAPLRQAVDSYPLRERLAGQLMLALYRAGRQAEALRAYAELRRRLGEGLGIDPDVTITELETAIIRHDDALLDGIAVSPVPGFATTTNYRDEFNAAVLAGGPRLRDISTAFDARRMPGPHDVDEVLAFSSVAEAKRCAVAALASDPSAALGLAIGASAAEEAVTLRRAASPGFLLVSEAAALIVGPHPDLRVDSSCHVGSSSANVSATALRLNVPDAAENRRFLPRGLVDDDDFWFVGRDAEIARVDEIFGETERGRSRTMLVSGEPGIGKTRFLAEAARRADRRDWIVLYGRCDESVRTPFQPFVDALDHFVTITPVHRLPALLGRHAGELSRLVPSLSSRLVDLAPPLDSDPETERYQLFQAVADWLRTSARSRPLLLLVDDIHWATQPTLLLLRHLARTADLDRCLLLVAYRDTKPERGEALDEMLADLSSVRRVDRCALAGLETTAVFDLLVHEAGMTADAATEEIATFLRDETGGNPFFVHELIRSLADSDDGRAYRSIGRAVPPTVRDVIAQRMARLPADVAEVLTAAAVVGRQFDVELLSAVTRRDEDAMLFVLDHAREAHLVQESGFDEYRFAHALVQSALYQPLTETRRIRLHKRVGEALEDAGATLRTRRVPELADHFLEAAPAGVVDKAILYAKEAAGAALEGLAFEDASNMCRRALATLDSARARGETCDDNDECDLVLCLGTADLRAGRAGARSTLLRAFGMARALGDAHRMATATLAMNRGFFSQVGRTDRNLVAALEDALAVQPPVDSDIRARLMAALASEIVWSDDENRRFALSDEALAMARRVGDARTIANVLLLRSMTISAPDTLPQRIAECRELLAIAGELHDHALEFYGAFHGSGTAMEAGNVSDATAMVAHAGELARDLNQPSLLFHTSMMRTSRHIFEGALDLAEQGVATTLELGKRASLHGEALIFCSELSLEIGRWRGRLAEMLSDFADLAGIPTVDFSWPLVKYLYDAGEHERAIERYREVMKHQSIPPRRDLLAGATLCNLAYLAAHIGDRVHAPALYDALAPLAGSFAHTTVTKPVTEHYLGLLAALMGHETTADEHFAAAVAIQQKVGAPLLVAETQLEWAHFLAGSGRTPSLRNELAAAVSSAATRYSAAFLAQGLDELARRSPTGPAPM